LTSTADIIKAFVDNEEESFSLFNYIQTINQECDRFLDERVKLENEMDEYKREQGEKEKKRKAIFDEYNNRLAGVREEKDRLHEANRDRKMTVLSIAKTVQGLYIRLKCRLLEKDIPGEEMSVNRSRERKLSMFAGEQISEQNILNHMTLIEKRAIQLIAAYANTLDESSSSSMKRHRSTLLSPKSFERSSLRTAHSNYSKESYTSVFDESDSDEDGSQQGRPASVHDLRRMEAEKLNKGQTPESRKSLIHSFFQ